MFRVIESQTIAPNVHLLTVEAPEVAYSMQPGQFAILRAEENGERIPLTPADWDVERGTLTFVAMIIGRTTRRIAELKAGDAIPTVTGPLGNPIELNHFGTVLCLGGCYGVASIYALMRALKQKGNRVVAVVEARSSEQFFWDEKLESASDQLIYISRDGTRGYHGHVAEHLPKIIKSQPAPVDRVIINGCNYLMKRGADTTLPLGIKTLVCLNTIMIDGTGMCGVCRVTVDGKMKFACVDGPYFDAHQVDWAELAKRRRSYLPEESVPLRSSRGAPRPVHISLQPQEIQR
jgi:ferredoxin--NADP+ reductase